METFDILNPATKEKIGQITAKSNGRVVINLLDGDVVFYSPGLTAMLGLRELTLEDVCNWHGR